MSVCDADPHRACGAGDLELGGLEVVGVEVGHLLARDLLELLENHIETDGREAFVGLSIETYRFEEDGSVVIRTYYRVPARTEDELPRVGPPDSTRADSKRDPGAV